jgi:outer membrane biosynthesis protein TonB
MGAFIVYILEWSACLLAFLLLYMMCFSGTTFHRFNRFYLLGTLVVSAMLPLIHIAPTEQMEPMAEACRTVVQVDESMLSHISVSSALGGGTRSLNTMEKVAVVLLVMYMLYVLIQLTGWAKSIVKMLRFIHGKRRRRIGRWAWMVEHDGEYGPFSWMNCIVISSHEQGFGRRASMRHELAHIALLHHLDLVLLMLCVIINPACWLVMKELKIVHEYEADDEVVNHYRIPNHDYQRLLLLRTVGAEAYALASSFNLNIKKRIMMMKKKQSHWWRMIWIAVTIPLVGFTLMAFSKPKEVLKEAVDNSVKIIEQPIAEVLKAEESTATPLDPVAPVVVKPQRIEQQPDQKPGDIITGTVSDEKGQPLQLANIVEEDEYHRIVAHTTTDINGRFTIKVANPQHKLRITYVGCQSKTLDISGNKMDVVLKANMKMNDIQVVGYPDSIDLNSPRYKEQNMNEGGDNTFNLVEQAPSFPGGYGELMNYLSRNLRYPPVAREMRVEAEILVQFTVDKTGFVRLPHANSTTSKTPLVTQETANAAREGDEEALEAMRNYHDAVDALKEEAIHVVRSMPRWEPGRQNGKRVETTYTLPINFKLNQ